MIKAAAVTRFRRTADAVVPRRTPTALVQPAEHLPDRGVPRRLDFRSDFRAASGRQQAHTLRIRKRKIKGRNSRVDPLADMLVGFRKGFAIEFFGVSIKDCPAHSIQAVTGDLVQPVGLLTHPQRRHPKRQTNTSPRPQQTARIVDAAVLKIWILVSSVLRCCDSWGE